MMEGKTGYRLCKNTMKEVKERAAFDALANQTFGISFDAWYRGGYWSETNCPYTLFDKERAVSNVSINRMELEYKGNRRHYIQLGTVMTDKSYEKRGLCRSLMEEVCRDWSEKCDSMFLFANRGVLDFYPRFGFRQQAEYQYRMCLLKNEKEAGRNVIPVSGDVRRLVMDDVLDIAILKRCYEKKNSFSALQTVEGFGLLMFYCGSTHREQVFYSKSLDAVMIAEEEGSTLYCLDIYYQGEKTLKQVLKVFLPEHIQTIVFGFTPIDTDGCTMQEVEDEDTVLFVLEGKENLFLEEKLFFPELSHT